MKAVQLPASTSATLIYGVASPAVPYVSLERLLAERPKVAVLVSGRSKELDNWAADLRFLCETAEPRKQRLRLRFYLLPDPETEDSLEDPRAFERSCDRLATLTALSQLGEGSPPAQNNPDGRNHSEADEIFCLLATPAALGQSLPAPRALQAQQLRLTSGQTQSFEALVKALPEQLGYDHEALCESPGQYAVRGGLIDVYPLNADAPVRIDFFGEEIESIRTFDPTTQRSDTGSHLAEVVITAATGLGGNGAANAARSHTVLDYLPADGVSWQLREPAALARRFPDSFAVPEKIAAPRSSFAHLVTARSKARADTWLGIAQLDESPELFADATRLERDTESLEPYAVRGETRLLGIARVELEQGARSRLFERLEQWQRQGNHIHLIARSPAELTRLQEILAEDKTARKLRPVFHVGELGEGFRIGGGIVENGSIVEGGSVAEADSIADGGSIAEGDSTAAAANAPTGGDSATNHGSTPGVNSAPIDNAASSDGSTPGGGSAPAAPLAGNACAVYVTEAEIFGRKRLRIVSTRKRRLPERKAVEQALDFSELVDGDYLVHLQNGICIFRGLQKLELKGRQEEVITLEFDEGIHLHLRLHESHLLSRYVGLSKITPKLGRLGTGNWEKARAGAERATLDFAAELLRLQAERDALPGFAFPQDAPWQHEFEAAFPFTETPDQLKAINDTKADMERDHPMDRLICGDVGFGKTEVAIRAAFKAVLAGKQVALLIPTTVLCLQHFKTFKERFADYPVVVEMLNRFRTPKQRTEIIRQVKAGKIDIIVGTHALLAKSVAFRDLGLLIVDEEHRFGVRQKEQIKHLKQDVDVVSMSATPIPRTLYFALMGARDLSVIETPPRERRPIETIVKAYDPKLVQSAIRNEMERGGQIFYLHNRVHTIDAVADNLRKLVPDARIGVGHGQMAEGALEKLMADFVDGRYDVLVCTTIIESGLDIPNCNTILIEGADRFGLSQLYQLRGRVGRFNRQAYCYLLLHRHGNLLDIARKRLGAIRQYNQLGAGFRIAMRDLELRGAGNLLGAKQHGPIATVGFDLYCQLLRQSVARLKGESPAKLIRAVVRLDFVIVGQAGDDAPPAQVQGLLPTASDRHLGGTASRGSHNFDKSPASAEVKLGYHALRAVDRQAKSVAPIEAYLPVSYIAETRLRIDFYRRLAQAATPADVTAVAEQMADRFGPLPPAVEALLGWTQIRVVAEQKGIILVESDAERLKCQLAKSGTPQFLKVGDRFPRLTAGSALSRMREILTFLKRQHDT